MTAKHSDIEGHSPNYQKTISWILGTITALLGIIAAVNALIDRPVIRIENQLALPIIVTVNGRSERVEAGDTKTIALLSKQESPAKVSWKVLRNKKSGGNQFLGEEIGEEFNLVDKGERLIVDNVIGLDVYFYPVVLNGTPTQCEIVVNDGLSIEEAIGISSPNTSTNIMGYYKYASNSNVTLKCTNQTYWLGKRNGQQSKGKINLELGSGVLEVSIP